MLGHDEVYNNGGFNFSTELYKLSSNNNNLWRFYDIWMKN